MEPDRPYHRLTDVAARCGRASGPVRHEEERVPRTGGGRGEGLAAVGRRGEG